MAFHDHTENGITVLQSDLLCGSIRHGFSNTWKEKTLQRIWSIVPAVSFSVPLCQPVWID